MWDKLESIEKRYEELENKLSSPEIVSQKDKLQEYSREHARISDTVKAYREYKKACQDLEQARELLQEESDSEMLDFLKEEIKNQQQRSQQLEQELKRLLLPRDPGDEKNVIMEIRAGTGGEEAALFAADLLRMYTRYAEHQGYKLEIMDMHPTDMGGVKEVTFAIEGEKVYSRLKFESGVHRVQRVPVTESGGRVHTSAATVAVLPEVEDIEVEVNSQDLRVDTFCSTGPGGQSVNTTQSAVRITHLPTGIVASCQDEKSQHKNKDKAMRVLRSRLYEKFKEEQEQEVDEARKHQVGSGDRSERIRTYNFPQNRVTDHRINLTLHKLEQVMDGNLDEFIEPLVAYQQSLQLANMEE